LLRATGEYDLAGALDAARRLLEREQYGAAEAAYREVLAHRGGNHEALHNTAVALYKSGEFDDALRYLRRAMEADGGVGRTHFLLGLVLADRDDIEGAIAAFSAAIRLDPSHADSYYYRGTLEVANGDLEAAIADLRRAAELRRRWPMAMHALSAAYARSGRWKECEACLSRCARIDPDGTSGYHSLLVQLGQVRASHQFHRQGHGLKNLLGILGSRLSSLVHELRERGVDCALLGSFEQLCSDHDRLHGDLQNLLGTIDPRPLEVQAVDVHELLDRCVFAASSALERARIMKKYDPGLPLTVCAPEPLEQAFLNLLLNAAEATSGGDIVTITTWHEEPLVYVCFGDTGIGVSADALDRLFDFGFTTKPNGSGIGLFQAKWAAELHGGRILVDSTPGAGAQFTLVLPLRGPPTGRIGALDGRPAPYAEVRDLIVGAKGPTPAPSLASDVVETSDAPKGPNTRAPN